MTITDYRNFDLLITRAGPRYKAIVVDAPAGEASILFDLPFAPDEPTGLGGLARSVRRNGRPVSGPMPAARLTDLGQRLFETIFRDKVGTLLAASLSSMAQEDAGLRLRLRFEEDVADLAVLPWETLYNPDQGHFVGLGEESPILRYLSLPRSRSALLVEPPLRVLAVLSSPAELPGLDLDREWQGIQDALAALVGGGKFVVERLATPSLAALQERLLGEPVHILHFVGHGVFDEASQVGSLALEDARGRSQFVRGEQLAALLRNHPAMRLAYLNACEGALASGGSVFTGVAQALVQGGVPAAVAMLAEISDASAIELARTFYTALAAGRPVDAALTQARAALSAADNPEWAVPVLFSRSPDNHLFDIREVLPTPDCPYPGMAPFSEAQKEFFFGRDREIEDAAERLHQHPFLAVVGPSGSGKSSLVYAGVIPTLRKSRGFGPREWTVHTLRPSDSRTPDGKAAPRQALARLLGCAADELAARTFDRRTLLLVDQFEELFTLAAAGEAQAFLDTLGVLMGRPNLYLLLTVRADFYPELMTCSLWPPIRANRLELTPLGDDELWAAVVEPAARVGVTVDEALAVQLIADAAGESGVLPLVQETLVLLWARVARRELKLAAYRAMAVGGRSGLQVAIDRRASLVYENLPDGAQPIARRIFLRLIQFGEGRADTRRQQTVAELRASGDDPALFDRTLARLIESRLLTASGEAGNPDRRVDISHEALIAGWPRLQEWLGQRRAAEQTRRRLEAKAAEWVETEKRGGLLDEYELPEAEKWLGAEDARELGYSRGLADLVKASKEALAQAEAEKEARRQRELAQAQRLADEQRLRAEEGERAAGRLRRRLATAAIAGMVAVAAFVAAAWFGVDANRQRDNARTALVTATAAQGQAEVEAQNAVDARETAEASASEAERQKQEAEQAARRAQAGEWVVLARTELTNKTDASGSLALILAREAVLTTWASDHTVTVKADAALRDAVDAAPPHRMTLPGHRHTAGVQSAAYSPDGRFIVTASHDGTARIWDAATGEQVRALVGHTCDSAGFYCGVNSAAYSPDGQFIVTAGWDGAARVWDVATGEEVHAPSKHTFWLRSAGYSPDGRLIVTAGYDTTARIWNAATGEEVRRLGGHTAFLGSAAYSPDGRFILTASYDGMVRISDAATGEALRTWDASPDEKEGTLGRRPDRVESASYSPDGRFVVTAGDNGTARTWDAATGEALRTLRGHGCNASGNCVVTSAAYSPDGRFIVTAGDDGTARIWDAATGEALRTLRGHGCDASGNCVVTSAAYSSDGRFIVTAGGDGTARIWNATTGVEVRTLGSHGGEVSSAAYSPDSRLIVTAGADGTGHIWDTATGEEVRTLSGHAGGVTSAAYSPDGRFIVTASFDGTARIWEAATGETVRTLNGHTSFVLSAAYSPDGRFIVTAGNDGTARTWDAATGERMHTLSGHAGGVKSATYNPDGRFIVTASFDGTARIWDAKAGAEVRTLSGHVGSVHSAVYSPDSQFVITAGADGTARIWDAATGKAVRTLSGHTGLVLWAAYSPDSRFVVTAGADGTARIWDAATGAAVRTLSGHALGVLSAAYSPNGRSIVTASADGTARIWDAAAGAEVRTLRGHTEEVSTATYSPDGRFIVTASYDGTACTWDTTTGEPVRTLRGHGCDASETCWVISANYSPNGRFIVTAGADGTARIWDAATGAEVRTLRGHTGWVLSAAYSPDGRFIVTAGGDGTAHIWDATTGELLRTLRGHDLQVTDAAYSPDGRFIITASADRTVRIWDAATGEALHTLSGHTEGVSTATYSPDGRFIVTASHDGTARIWDPVTGEQVCTLSGHGYDASAHRFVYAAAYSPDGRFIVTAGSDGTARVWDAATGEEVRTLSGHTGAVFSAAYSPDGRSIVSGSLDKTARVWIAGIDDLLTEAARLIQRDPPRLTAEEQQHGLE